ncbi:uncharacterized protein [Spinacia oleracea]|uniref:Reverse transcriptase zinc-binding domain-containing protein n=1 Tax=Spinacia oleracea TaxID=3562 RepID=A0A9R0IBH5_SPIOL|nr:uncharacterized protein LOC110785930 [Spinacia oleracea]
MCSMSVYSVKQVYQKLAGSNPAVHWDKLVWNRLSLAKRRFICWLAVQKRLHTTAVLARIGISSSAACLLCAQSDEDHNHLFFNCQYSKECLEKLTRWFGIQIQGTNLLNVVNSPSHRRYTKFRRMVYYAGVSALVYLIWRSRNSSYWNQLVFTTPNVIASLKQIVRSRILVVMPKKVSRNDHRWFVEL